ncbi:protein translocase subunit SecD [Mycetocola reblochoni]|uniref:Protein translocase subunit SecD n=1 Tax=Mycetocola reblochoni REB411 TaxID=1255698 RepID=A0A1R4J3D8_9MICO|nr:protein translocase subunit SecD [Mycetocola reblochoni]SJN26548.1 Protein-export membrane protein SecD (TC 3.A.5.1.1) [Mycetocola reblochoni REB411]
MAPTSSTPVRQARKTLTWLGALTAVLAAALVAGVIWSTASWAPKLALDLEGGTQVILSAKLSEGQQVSQDQLNQAVSIIRQRVDASGVSEAEISTQGSSNIVVSMPGEIDDATRERIESSAQLQFRPVIATSAPANTFVGEDQVETPYPTPDDSMADTPSAEPTDASDPNWITERLSAEFLAYNCAEPTDASDAPADEPLITCATDGTAKYLLGPVELTGESITDATAGIQSNSQGASTGVWGVNIVLNGHGTEVFGDISQRLYGAEAPQNQFAFVLDGSVLSAPSMNGLITNGKPSITGSFNQDSAQALADQLKYGALPISFTVQSSDTISATLGDTQLQIGLIFGLIGLLLVVVYTLFQYRLLGFVTIASLIVAGVLTYLAIALLSWREGYRLSLAGVAGLIVAIGFTADSFIVYFERIRDELRDGRGLESAVEAGWRRAKRTIFASKAVNLLSAVVLYVLAVGNVRGFAFTLGVTTIIDVIVVFLFTHPMMQLLAKSRFFSSGHPATGLDPHALGAIYRGRAQFRAPDASVSASKRRSSKREVQRRQTIAERKAAELGDNRPEDGKDS